MRKLKKPIREVVETLLKYRFGEEKVFKLTGTGFKPDAIFSTNEEASLDNPSSLEFPEYRIIYFYKITGDEERCVNFGSIKKNPRIPGETLLSDLKFMDESAEKVDEIYRRLEDALNGM